MSKQPNAKIAPATGKLGILVPGMDAVTTTFIAGLEAVKRGLGQPVGSGSFKTKEETKLSVLQQILQPDLYRMLYKDLYHAVRINYYPPPRRCQRGMGQHRYFWVARLSMQIKIDFLCRDSILAAPSVLDLVLFLDLAQRAGMKGIQEWLSFYFKGPMTAEGLYPEHDIFIQLMKLKNTLRWMQGEELVTHLGLEYYD